MYYSLKENGEIGATSRVENTGYLYTDEEIVRSYDGLKLLFKHQTETEEYRAGEREYLRQKHLDDLRFLRKTKCFPIVNRGQVWYESLSITQITELKAWYRAWLDVTITLTEPSAPAWLT